MEFAVLRVLPKGMFGGRAREREQERDREREREPHPIGRVFSGFPSAAPILRFLLAIWYFQVAVNNLSEILPVSAVVNNQDFRCTRSCRTLVELLLVPGQELDGMIIVDYTTVPYVMCNALY